MKNLLVAILVIQLFSHAVAQQDPSYEFPFQHNKPNLPYWTDYVRHSTRIVTSPLRWDRKSWAQAGWAVGTGLVLYRSDAIINQRMMSWSGSGSRFVSDIVRPFGSKWYPIPLGAVLYTSGALLKKPRLKVLGLQTTQVFVITALGAQLTKSLVGRESPEYGASNSFYGPSFDGSRHSFYSGHSSTAFAMATLLAEEFKEKKWVGVVCYSVAGLVALSRIHDNEHWASDVFVGSVAGHVVTKYIVRKWHSKSSISLKRAFSIRTKSDSSLLSSHRYN